MHQSNQLGATRQQGIPRVPLQELRRRQAQAAFVDLWAHAVWHERNSRETQGEVVPGGLPPPLRTLSPQRNRWQRGQPPQLLLPVQRPVPQGDCQKGLEEIGSDGTSISHYTRWLWAQTVILIKYSWKMKESEDKKSFDMWKFWYHFWKKNLKIKYLKDFLIFKINIKKYACYF